MYVALQRLFYQNKDAVTARPLPKYFHATRGLPSPAFWLTDSCAVGFGDVFEIGSKFIGTFSLRRFWCTYLQFLGNRIRLQNTDPHFEAVVIASPNITQMQQWIHQNI